MIVVLAGVNGAGKSSIGGSALRANGLDWYNPDEVARELHLQYPQKSIRDINGDVWREGHKRLQQAVNNDTHFAFETTLGGRSITESLLDAIAAGRKVSVWYCGLNSPELHIQRVAERVKRGGHNIPEAMVRKRCQSSMRNLCRLAPGVQQLAVYDNSAPLDENRKPGLRKLLHVTDKNILHIEPSMPEWAKPVAAVCALHSAGSTGDSPG